MKGLKKLVLVTAIAATPLVANAQLKALNDSTLGSVTGQAGVTVEVQTQIGIGSIVYTDTDGSGQTGDTAGHFIVQGVAIGGSGVGAATGITSAGSAFTDCTANCSLNDLALAIDVNGQGTATINLINYDHQPVDFGVAIDKMGTAATSATDLSNASNSTVLLSNFRMQGNLYALGIAVGKDTGAGSAQNSLYGYFSQLDAALGTSMATPFTSYAPGNGVANSNNGDVLMMGVGFAITNMQFDVPLMAVGVKSMTITGANGGPAVAQMAVYAGGSLMSAPGVGDANGNVLRVDVQTSPMNINMGEIDVGGASIGSVAINGLTLTNTHLAVYGH